VGRYVLQNLRLSSLGQEGGESSSLQNLVSADVLLTAFRRRSDTKGFSCCSVCSLRCRLTGIVVTMLGWWR